MLPIGSARGDMLNKKTLSRCSMFLGILYLMGMLWFGDVIFKSPVDKLILLLSPGVSLILSPILCNISKHYKLKTFAIISILLIGIVSSFYGIYFTIRSSGFIVDQLVVIVQYSIVILILVLIGLYNLREKQH